MASTLRSRAGIAALAMAVALTMVSPAFAQVPALPKLPSSVGATVPFQPIATVYEEGFDFDDGGYTKGGSASWAFGEPASPPAPVAGQSPGMWGTNLAGAYGNNECGWVQSAPISLADYPPAVGTGASAARLAFRHWFQLEHRWDLGIVQASADGATWATLTPVGGYNNMSYSSAVRACLGLDATGRGYTSPSGTPMPPADAWAPPR